LQVNLGFLSIDIGTILFTLINTLILMLGLKHFLFDKVNSVLEKRKEAISADYDKAALTKEEAEKIKSEYSELMQNSKQEAANIVKTAQNDAQKRSDDIITQAKNEANTLKEKAHTDIELESKKAKASLKDEISNLAVQIASKIVEREVKKGEHDRFITEFIETVGEF